MGRKPSVSQLLADEKAKVALLEEEVKELNLKLADSGFSEVSDNEDVIALVKKNTELFNTLADAECYMGGVQTVTTIVREKLERHTQDDKIKLPWKEWVSLLNQVWYQVVLARFTCEQKQTNIKVNPVISGILSLIGFNLNPNI